jgi:hypothetical protein
MATTKTELYNNGTLVATKTSAPFNTFDWTPANGEVGSASLTVKRYEDGVLVATSAAVGGTVDAAAGGGYSTEATTVFGRMNTAPPTAYKDAMATFIDSLVTNGIWGKIDEIQCPALDTSANGLVGWKGVSNATLVGGVTHTPKVGHVHNGTNGYTNTGFIPSTMGVQYQDTSAFLARLYTSVSVPASIGVSGVYPADVNARVNLVFPSDGGNTSMRLNTTTSLTFTGKTAYNTNTLYTQYRTASTQYLYQGATESFSGPSGGGYLSDIALFEGAANTASGANYFHPMTQFIRIYGGGVLTAQNFTDFNNAVQTFKTAITNIA